MKKLKLKYGSCIDKKSLLKLTFFTFLLLPFLYFALIFNPFLRCCQGNIDFFFPLFFHHSYSAIFLYKFSLVIQSCGAKFFKFHCSSTTTGIFDYISNPFCLRHGDSPGSSLVSQVLTGNKLPELEQSNVYGSNC